VKERMKVADPVLWHLYCSVITERKN